MNVNKSVPSAFYDRGYYNHLLKIESSDFRMNVFQKASSLVPLYRKVILDIGCGIGSFIPYCIQKGAIYFGIDYNNIALAQAKKFYLGTRKSVNLFQMNATKLAFSAHVFDIVFMLDFVEHLYQHELEQSLSEVKRILKPGGMLIVHTFPTKWQMEVGRFILKIIGQKSICAQFHPNEQTIFSLKKTLNCYFRLENIWLERIENFWSLQVDERLQMIKRLVSLFDYCIDWRPVSFFVDNTFLKYFFATSIWAVARTK